MIKWLIATKETQGQRPNDFNWCNEREVVFTGFSCHNGETPDDSCGCGRSFSGLETSKGTTTMQVVALPWDPCDLIKAVLKSHERAGFTMDPSTGMALEFEVIRLLGIVNTDEFHYGDIVEYRGTEGLQLRRAYYPTHTYQCPSCLSHEHIDICADIWVRLVQNSADNFETDIDEAHNHDHEWDGNHGAVCQNCNFGFNVDKFETEDWRPAEEDDDEEEDRYCAEPLCCQEPEPNRSYCVHHSHLEEKYKCQNCGEMWSEEKLKPISHLEQRVAAGEPMPAGECPDCGAVCHEEMGDDEPGLCTVHGTPCEGDGTGAVICPKCSQTEEGKERL